MQRRCAGLFSLAYGCALGAPLVPSVVIMANAIGQVPSAYVFANRQVYLSCTPQTVCGGASRKGCMRHSKWRHVYILGSMQAGCHFELAFHPRRAGYSCYLPHPCTKQTQEHYGSRSASSMSIGVDQGIFRLPEASQQKKRGFVCWRFFTRRCVFATLRWALCSTQCFVRRRTFISSKSWKSLAPK